MRTFFFLALALLTQPATATTVMPLTLQQLSTQASTILYGEVIDNHAERDPQSGQIVTLTTFRVTELIKGQISDPLAGTHTIKQLGGSLPAAGGSRQRLMIHGVPTFTVGTSYVVFLPRKSSLGFSSPLGLHQGSLTVEYHDGQAQVRANHSDASRPQEASLKDTTWNKTRAVFAGSDPSPAPSNLAPSDTDPDSRTSHRLMRADRLSDFISRVKAYNGH